MKQLFLMVAAICALTSCDSGDDDGPKSIKLTGGTSTKQTIYADETTKADGIQFEAVAPWKARVKSLAGRSGSEVEWLTLSAYEGDAGLHKLTMTLLENTTGVSRKAKIEVQCGTTTITILVEQKATTKDEDNEEPKPIARRVTCIESDVQQKTWSSTEPGGGFGINFYQSKTNYFYDQQGRISRVVSEGESTNDDNGVINTIALGAVATFTYTDTSITIEYASTTEAWRAKKVATITNGKISLIQSYEEDEGEYELEDSYAFTYQGDYLSLTSRTTQGKTYTYTPTWSNGNLVRMYYKDPEQAYGSSTDAVYSATLLNAKPNIDLQWLVLSECDDYFTFMCAEGVLALFDNSGVRSKNMIQRIDSGSTTFHVEYAFSGAYPAMINVSSEFDPIYFQRHRIIY